MSVIDLTASPLAKDYFRHAIVQSGAFMASGNLKSAEESGMKFAKRMGVNSIAELRSEPAAEIQRLRVPTTNSTSAMVSPAMPVVDGYFLTKSPRAVYEAGEENTHSLMAGSNANEGTTLISAVLTEK